MKGIFQRNVTLAGKSYNGSVEIESDNDVGFDVSLAAAKTGTLTTRTDNNTGTLTMAASHGIITGDIIDIYWTDSGIEYCQRTVTVGTVSVNSVPIDLGIGDNLPAAASEIRAMVVHEESIVLTGNNCVGIAISSDQESSVVIAQSAGTEIYALAGRYATLQDNSAWNWFSGNGVTNPIAGATVGKVRVTHGYSGGSARIRGRFMYN